MSGGGKSKKNKESGEGTRREKKVDKSRLKEGSEQATAAHQRRDLTGDLIGDQHQQNPTPEADYTGVCACGYCRAMFHNLY